MKFQLKANSRKGVRVSFIAKNTKSGERRIRRNKREWVVTSGIYCDVKEFVLSESTGSR